MEEAGCNIGVFVKRQGKKEGRKGRGGKEHTKFTNFDSKSVATTLNSSVCKAERRRRKASHKRKKKRRGIENRLLSPPLPFPSFFLTNCPA